MNISVVFLGPYADIAAEKNAAIVLPDGARAAELLLKIANSHLSSKPGILDHALIARDGRSIDSDTVLRDGDRILILSPMVGGG